MCPESWDDEWQVALFEAKMGTPFIKAGIPAREFGQLAGIGGGTVNLHAARGIEHFREHFAEHCDFWEIDKTKSGQCVPYQRFFTFYGVLHPQELHRYGVWLLTLEDFAQRHQVDVAQVQSAIRQGHGAFRERFEGWEFFTRRPHSYAPLEYWFGRLEDLGAREDDAPIPDDFLTTEQFARLQGLTTADVMTAAQAGRRGFESQFAGWSFVGLNGINFRFVRLKDAVELFTVKDFAQQARPLSSGQIRRLLEAGSFAQKFPGFYAKRVKHPHVAWLIFRRPGAQVWAPPPQSLSMRDFANLTNLALLTLGVYVRQGKFEQLFPGWQVAEHPANRTRFLYPAATAAPNPPRTAVELYGLLSMREAGEALGVCTGQVKVWANTPRLLQARAPGWTVVRLTFKGKSVWLKPPQCLLSERPEC
ncbi:hypothetical protein [Leptolyngbya iicbica]|uniref:Uncharacterized protein n=2 Tax=Cyanophyceae TaxID=3028117 RepID=A0A4Q7EAD9_9CYAN|nr:hypothetical protein [Leptolyngbya sp. LK]RZM79551.1 hypothetical protein DYY88_12595 [Leptolyngbya sp. LK]